MDEPCASDRPGDEAAPGTPRRPDDDDDQAEGEPVMRGDQPDFTDDEIALMDEVCDELARDRQNNI